MIEFLSQFDAVTMAVSTTLKLLLYFSIHNELFFIMPTNIHLFLILLWRRRRRRRRRRRWWWWWWWWIRIKRWKEGARKMYLSVSGRETYVVFAYSAKMASASPAVSEWCLTSESNSVSHKFRHRQKTHFSAIVFKLLNENYVYMNSESSKDAKCQFKQNWVIARKVLYSHPRTL